MNTVFADTCYWIALVNQNDNLHSKAKDVSQDLGHFEIVTSEMVFVELLNYMSGKGEQFRKGALQIVWSVKNNPTVNVVPQTCSQFENAVAYYASRPDQEWSVTDCASFKIMEEKGIQESLTNDHHFEQAGFTILL